MLAKLYCQPRSLIPRCSRQLDDAELDSGDDEGRTDRVVEDDAVQFEEQEMLTMDMQLPRQPAPEPSDGEVRCRSTTHLRLR